MQKSQLFQSSARMDSLDLATIDPAKLRAEASRAADLLPMPLRKKLIKLDETTTDGFLSNIYDELLPHLKQVYTRSNKKSLRETLADTYDITLDESRIIAEALRDKRSHSIVTNYLDDALMQLSSSDRESSRKLVHELFDHSSTPEMTTALENFFIYRALDDTAKHTLVTYVDPQSSRHTQRKARKEIKKQERTYGESLKDHRENALYRLSQLSCIYNGLLEDIIMLDLDPEELVTMATNYQKQIRTNRKQSAKLHQLIKLLAPATDKYIDESRTTASQLDDIDHLAACAKVLSRVIHLSQVQRDLLPERAEEYRSLALDYSRIRSKRSRSSTREKMLVV